MNYLPEIKNIDNNNFEVYSNKLFSKEFNERFTNFLCQKKKEILDFFKIDSFRKVRINLFDNKKSYYDFSIQYINISSYNIGNCCAGMINYVYDENDLEDFGKARISYGKYSS